ncbi:type II toxin-antitoxin system Phd/YefM family antitoxin [Nocardioides sp. WS12]|uniref:type II toxin-antitoxin system Phd/YefM family antitoxin n=1 Tax=Nocardioides sp. WS12 TaxID=2486272 RepID=UPI0015F9021E|nr:type II toxin-antitoxin system Phd/YefM family antitoxin [Nocardioides sp. WS12]
MTLITSREFNRDVSAAKRAALGGPVVITDKGRPSHVLLSISDYEELKRRAGTLADRLMGPPGAEDIEIPLPPREIEAFRPLDL